MVVEVSVCLSLRSASGLVFQMKFQPNDLQQLREMCDEIKIFEGIQHPNLVKYYGVEVHKVRRRKRKGEGGRGRELGTQNFIIRKRGGGGNGERTQNSELYDSRIEILGSSLFLQSVLAKLHRQHI